VSRGEVSGWCPMCGSPWHGPIWLPLASGQVLLSWWNLGGLTQLPYAQRCFFTWPGQIRTVWRRDG